MPTVTTPPPSRGQLVAAVNEAAENLAYWTRQAVVRTNPTAIAQAKGLREAWGTTFAARQKTLRDSTKH